MQFTLMFLIGVLVNIAQAIGTLNMGGKFRGHFCPPGIKNKLHKKLFIECVFCNLQENSCVHFQ